MKSSFAQLALSGLFLCTASGIAAGRADVGKTGLVEQWASLEPLALKAPVPVDLARNPLQPLSNAPALRSFSGERAELGERLSRYLKGRVKSVLRDGDRSAVFIGARAYVQGQEIALAEEGSASARSLKVVLKRIEAERLVFLVTYSSSASVLPADVAVPLDPFCHAR